MRILIGIVLAALAIVATGCSTYRQDYVYDPAMQVSGGAPPRLFSTVVGVLRGDDEVAPGVEVRVRLEAGRTQAEVLPDSLQLVTADLVQLELVRVEPAGAMVAPANGAGMWRLIYAFPADHDAGSLDLSGLEFSWGFRVGGMSQMDSDTFRRYRDPYWNAPYPYYWNSGYWYHGGWGHGHW